MTVTRFAPSPTGRLHVGNLRTALMNWLIARQAGGTFILRLDDTDAERSKPEYADAIRRDLEWLGLTWDRLERQSDRLDRYHAAAERLRGAGRLYEVFETAEELELRRRRAMAGGRPPVYDRAALKLTAAERDALRAERPGYWRFLLEEARVGWQDGILGPVSIDAASLSDPVLIRGDGQVLYTLASVVDDVEMGVTDVVRGADHVTNTAVQVQIMAALGAAPPRFAHHSLLTGPGGEALSKRLGALSLAELREQGVEPMALLSLMARLGSADPVEPRATPGELVAGFDLSRFGAAPVRFDPDELRALSAKVLHGLDYPAVAGDLAALGVDRPEAFWARCGRTWRPGARSRMVGARPRRRGAGGGRGGPGLRGAGRGAPAAAALGRGHLGGLDRGGEGRDRAQGRRALPAAAALADRAGRRAGHGAADAVPAVAARVRGLPRGWAVHTCA
jgi:glutamyl-tRNA synthetase